MPQPTTIQPAPDSRRRSLPLVLYPASAEEALIRRLALDRLRDLREDGVTWDYVGRMYGVGGEQIRSLARRLRRRA